VKLKLQEVYQKIARLNKREKFVFNLTALVLSLVILDRLIISPITSKIANLNKAIKDEETLVKKNLRILALKDKIISQKTKFDSYLTSSGSDEEEVTSLLKEIESLANKSTVYLIDMKPAGLKESGSTKKYIINLNLEAQMEQIISFMYYIESSDRIFTVEKYDITPKSRSSSVARCGMTISKIAMP